MSDKERRGPGRPRKWTDEAERKRAYRVRRAAELAEPARMRDEAREAREEVSAARSELDRARRALQRAEQRAAATERRATKLVDLLQNARADVRRARVARDKAEKLLRQKLAGAKDARHLRDDPDALLAVIAEQRRLLDWYRRRVGQLERDMRAHDLQVPPRGNP